MLKRITWGTEGERTVCVCGGGGGLESMTGREGGEIGLDKGGEKSAGKAVLDHGKSAK